MGNQTKRVPKQKPLKPTYLIHGDRKMIDDALVRLKKRISNQVDLDFNFDQFNGSRASASEIIQAANTLPFMSEKRLIIVKEVDKLPKDDALQLAGYAENPSESTCLVLVAGSINKASQLYKAIAKAGEIAEYKLNKSPIIWIKEQFGERGKLVSDSLAKYLLHVVGLDLSRLDTEIEKISLYHAGDRIVDPGEIESVVTKSSEVSIFDLAGNIGERNIPKAIETLHYLIQQKEVPLGILNLIARHFRLVLRTKVWVEGGHDNRYIIDHLTGDEGKKLPHFVVAKYREQSYNFSLGELKRVFNRLLEADVALKSSPQTPESILEDLIIKLAV
ncbi:MAG: DNA polymerase III subunit delta [Actinobacteria bacterium]|nr:DNA polymerase III subunit delta [Actinomycetota bacterium]